LNRHSTPRPASIVFKSPVFGDPKIVQATPATRGGTKRGSKPAVAIRPFHGVFVRTTIQAKAKPIATAIAVPPVQAMSELSSAAWTFGLARTETKFTSDISAGRKPSTTGLPFVKAP
jgi:hypothetical protein